MDIQGKSALVTGGASGIGLACVKELLRSGAQHVAVCDYDVLRGEEVLRELAREHGQDKVIFIKTDVTKDNEFEDAFKLAISTFKSLDIVINNAGIIDAVNWERLVAVNLGGIIRGTLLALQYMGKNKGGRGGILCNTASIVGVSTLASFPTYSASKHGVVGLSRCYGLPFYFSRTGVRVVAMCPGLTSTPLASYIMDIDMDEEDSAQLQKDVASLPVQKPENVAVGMMELIKSADSGTVWVSEGDQPVYEVVIPHYSELRKK